MIGSRRLRRLGLLAGLIVGLCAGAAPAQEKHDHSHHGKTELKETPKDTKEAKVREPAGQDPHAGHDAGGDGEKGDHAGHAMMMTTVTGGPFRTMQALGSGTALQPASTPMAMWFYRPGEWSVMLHADVKVGFNHQGGPRGVGKAESQNWLMAMAERNVGPGRLMLRGMFSGEGLTFPHGGSPQLLQTGETYRGIGIVDAQHPHDLFMELAASYTIPLGERVSFQVYGGPVGEPALGPVAFMHRASAMDNPAVPLSHHFQDSTHITHGVVTAALTAGRLKFEASAFRGREPDEDRVGLDLGKLDSYSFRATYTPTANWSMQVSGGHVKSPEVLVPSLNVDKLTASVSYNRPLRRGNWASTLVWGRSSDPYGAGNSYLFESALRFRDKNTLYTRLELVDKISLLADNIWGRPGLGGCQLVPVGSTVNLQTAPAAKKAQAVYRHHFPVDPNPTPIDPCPPILNQSFRVGGFTFGGTRDFFANGKIRLGVGADLTVYHMPAALDPVYGNNPVSYRIFLRFRPDWMR